jgi:hypothetical protein
MEKTSWGYMNDIHMITHNIPCQNEVRWRKKTQNRLIWNKLKIFHAVTVFFGSD